MRSTSSFVADSIQPILGWFSPEKNTITQPEQINKRSSPLFSIKKTFLLFSLLALANQAKSAEADLPEPVKASDFDFNGWGTESSLNYLPSELYSLTEGTSPIPENKQPIKSNYLLTASYTDTFALTLGGSLADKAYTITNVTGGGYVLCAQTSSYGAGSTDFLMAKITASGELV